MLFRSEEHIPSYLSTNHITHSKNKLYHDRKHPLTQQHTDGTYATSFLHTHHTPTPPGGTQE
jgi:hypothetical protein